MLADFQLAASVAAQHLYEINLIVLIRSLVRARLSLGKEGISLWIGKSMYLVIVGLA